MKRIITIVLYISILCGCGGIQGLRIHNEQLPPGKQEIDGGIYYNTKEKGHNSDVKHKLMNQDGFSIIIPVRYINEKREGVLPPKIPTVLKEEICPNYYRQKCELEDRLKEIKLLGFGSYPNYYKINRDNLILYSYNETHKEYNISEFKNSLTTDELEKLGIKIEFDIVPSQLILDCDKKFCVVVDENKKIVNEILISKSIKIDEDKIKKLYLKEMKKMKNVIGNGSKQKKNVHLSIVHFIWPNKVFI